MASVIACYNCFIQTVFLVEFAVDDMFRRGWGRADATKGAIKNIKQF